MSEVFKLKSWVCIEELKQLISKTQSLKHERFIILHEGILKLNDYENYLRKKNVDYLNEIQVALLDAESELFNLHTCIKTLKERWEKWLDEVELLKEEIDDLE